MERVSVKDYEKFSPEEYLTKYYNDEEGAAFENEYLRFLLDNLNKISNLLSERSLPNDGLLIDVGSGPCIHSTLSLSSNFNRIICADIASSNRAAIQKWLARDESAHSWDAVIQYCASLENKITAEQLENRVRKSIVDVKYCDVLNDVPVEGYRGQADAVISSLCIEAACNSIEQYRKAVHNTTQLIKPGGFLILVGVLGETFYKVGDLDFYALKLSLADVEQALAASQMKVECIDELKRSETDQNHDETDWSSSFVLLATKAE